MRASIKTILLTGAVLQTLSGLALSDAAHAADAVSTFKDWSLYVHQDKSGKLCYIASVPSKQEGTFSKRGQPAVMVAKLPSAPPNEQVSVQPGYTYKTGSDVTFTVDSTKFSLFTQGEHAWAKTSADDKALIDALRKGTSLKVSGTSARNTTSNDTYSLSGFTAAYNAMRDKCPDGKKS
ncbi:invasion associated locus B family protein [Arboricoccus pini]|nr:invasion associated locus B family protein [Arboricoccus pini]